MGLDVGIYIEWNGFMDIFIYRYRVRVGFIVGLC